MVEAKTPLTVGEGNVLGGSSAEVLTQDHPRRLRDVAGSTSTEPPTGEDETQAEEPAAGFCGLSRTKKLVIVTFCLSNFFVGAFYSIIGPFYPKEAKDRGMDETEIGMVFGIYELALVLASPVLGKFLTKLGAKFVFIAGLMCCGYCAILFGFVDDMVNNLPAYRAFSFLLRAVEGFGAAGINTASFAIMAHTFPHNIGVMFGTLEAFSGLGMMIGPLLGGALYQVGGFRIPFFTTGAMLIVLGIVTFFTLQTPDVISAPGRSASVFGLLRMPEIAVVGLLIIMGSAAIGFTTVVLSLILENSYGLTVTMTSFAYLIGPAIYMVAAPLWGAFADKRPSIAVELVVIGYVIAGLAFWLMGPTPFLHVPDHLLWLLLLTQAVLGFGIAAFVITFKLIPAAASAKYGDSLETFSLVAGLCNGFLSTGAFAGPVVGGALYHKVGFAWATHIMGCLVLFSALVLFVFNCVSRCCERTPASNEERRPLLEDAERIGVLY